MVLLHIGYFNDLEDLKMMFNSPADEIIFNYKLVNEESYNKYIQEYQPVIDAFEEWKILQR